MEVLISCGRDRDLPATSATFLSSSSSASLAGLNSVHLPLSRVWLHGLPWSSQAQPTSNWMLLAADACQPEPHTKRISNSEDNFQLRSWLATNRYHLLLHRSLDHCGWLRLAFHHRSKATSCHAEVVRRKCAGSMCSGGRHLNFLRSCKTGSTDSGLESNQLLHINKTVCSTAFPKIASQEGLVWRTCLC